MGDMVYNSHESERCNSVPNPSSKKWLSQLRYMCTTWQYCRKESCYQTVERYPSFEQYCRPHVCEYTYFHSAKKYFKNFADIMVNTFLNPHSSCTRDGNMTMSLAIYFIHLGNKDIYCTLQACYEIVIWFPTIHHLFHTHTHTHTHTHIYIYIYIFF
jgi:hypothetical protein